jgi:hypothetical protein
VRIDTSVTDTMPTYKGNRGNLLQHWVLTELVVDLQALLPESTTLCFFDAHAMSPYASRDLQPGQTGAEFDRVANGLPGQLSTYEKAWQELRSDWQCTYPTSASFVRHLWRNHLRLVLCERDPVTAEHIRDWLCAVAITESAELFLGDWRERLQQPLPQADAYMISFDPYMFDRHAAAPFRRPGNMGRSDVYLLAHIVRHLRPSPVLVQISTYSANNANRQSDVVTVIEPILEEAGLRLDAIVKADGNMMSLIFSGGLAGLPQRQIAERFKTWLHRSRTPFTHLR